MENKDGRQGLSRRRGLRRVALVGTAALAVAGLAQVTGSAFAADAGMPAVTSVTLKLTNAPTRGRDTPDGPGAPFDVKSVRVVDNDGTGPFDRVLGCFPMTPGQTVDTGQKVVEKQGLTVTLFGAEKCVQEIPGGVIVGNAWPDDGATEFVLDLDDVFRNG